MWQNIKYKRDGLIKKQFVDYENISLCWYYYGDSKHGYESCAMRIKPPEVFYLIKNEGTEGDN